MAINRTEVIENLSKLEVKGDCDGLIPAFGVFVNALPVSFWNAFSERLSRKVDPSLTEAAEFLLTNAAHECGYHTGYGIITSEEWKAVVAPMIEQVPEDVLHGAYAVLAAFGWANAEIVELVAGEKMVVRAVSYYEADVAALGRSSKMSSYMLRGICAAFMDLAYGAPYPAGIKTFRGEQTKGIECGDPYGEFVVRRA